MRLPVHRFRALLLLVLALMPGSPKAATPQLSETNLTTLAWQVAATNLSTRVDADATQQPRLLEIYTNALTRAKGLEELRDRSAEYNRAILNATNQTASLRSAKPTESGLPENLNAMNSSELDAAVSQVEADLAVAQKTLAGLEAEFKQRTARRSEVPKETAESKNRLDEIDVALKAKPDANEPPEVSRANRLFHLTRRAFREQQIATLELELKAYQATADLLSLQLEQASARVATLTRSRETVFARLAEVRKAEAKAAAEAARQRQAEARHPVLKALAATNALFAGELVQLNESIQRANNERTTTEKDLTSLELAFKNLATRVTANEAAGVKITDSIGVLLRRHRVDLARRSDSTTGIRDRIARLTEVQLREIDLKDQKAGLPDLETMVTRALLEMGQKADGESKADVIDVMRDRVKLLTDLAASHEILAESLGRINLLELRLRNSTRAFQHFVEERVLWTRSANPLGLSKDGAQAFTGEALTYAVLISWRTWRTVLEAFFAGVAMAPVSTAFFTLAVLVAFGLQPLARRRLKEQFELARQASQTSLLPTLKSLCLTFVLALPGPMLTHAIGQTLTQGYAPAPVTLQLGAALTVAAFFYFTLGFYRQFLRKHGLAVGHFGWPTEAASKIRRHLGWFVAVTVPASAFIVFAEARIGEGGEDRITFISLMLMLACFLHLLFNPSSGLAFNPTNQRTGATARRLRYLAGVLMPVGLAITSALGYHLTAIEFSWRLANSIWLVLGITLASSIIVRWFYLERRQIALEKLRIKREAATHDEAGKAKLLETELPEISVIEVKEQTQSLLRTLVLISLIGGLWTIWSGVLPALNVLDRKALWHVEEKIQPRVENTTLPAIPGLPAPSVDEAPVPSEDGATEQPKTIRRPITLANLLLAAFILVVTGIAARNLPGFLEISILKHLKLETGGGYAITTIVQYVVTIIGIVVACSTIGLSWEKVQWLAAAVTLGIGFGLQEIFANFVAGIILLFERPVRVGDIITVENTTGAVSRIRIRATTVVNWERQELIIPNKDLVTGRLTNWTLSDNINRIVITVGIAYGSDTRLAGRILTEILEQNRYVLDEPKPRVTFDLFGESCLNFTIRAYIGSMDDRLNAIHSLHTAIDDRFREHDIEIAFPQRDLHLRTVPPGFGEIRPGA